MVKYVMWTSALKLLLLLLPSLVMAGSIECNDLIEGMENGIPASVT